MKSLVNSKSPESGLVGFFDILGYGKLQENDDLERIVALIESTILTLPQMVQSKVISLFPDDSRILNAALHIGQEFSWLVFSDTILVALPVSPTATLLEKTFAWNLFLIHCTTLYRSCYENGLPLRGAISF